MVNRRLRIGTRGSKMALLQAKTVRTRLEEIYPELEPEIVVIETSGDWRPEHGEVPLSEVDGGKGLFAKEIETALLNDKVDIGVHSVKDMPSFLPEGLSMLHYLGRNDARDAFVSQKYKTLSELPQGAIIGSTSVRRRAFLLHMRPDLNVIDIRGNVTTRIEKMLNGKVDALILSASGLDRIQQNEYTQTKFSIDQMLPACGQGTIGIEFREMDTDIRELLAPLHDVSTGYRMSAERGALRALNGSCSTPIGAYSTIENDLLTLHVTVLRRDGTKKWEDTQSIRGDSDHTFDSFGFKVGLSLKNIIDPDVLI